jgi:hypothetical protein
MHFLKSTGLEAIDQCLAFSNINIEISHGATRNNAQMFEMLHMKAKRVPNVFVQRLMGTGLSFVHSFTRTKVQMIVSSAENQSKIIYASIEI